MSNKFLKNGIIQSGAKDVRQAAQALAHYVPSRLAPLARVAYNYHWVWQPDGEQIFRDIDAHRWRLCRQNPVRFLQEAPELSLERAAANRSLVDRVDALRDALEDELNRPPSDDGISPEHPVAFFLCRIWPTPLAAGLFRGTWRFGRGYFKGSFGSCSADGRHRIVLPARLFSSTH